MINLKKIPRRSLLLGLSVFSAAVIFYLYRSWSYDDPYITFRFAQNLSAGNGFVYNPGERILSTTTPLFAMLLGLLGPIWANIPGLAVLIGAASLGVSGFLIAELASDWGLPLAAWAGCLLLPTFGLLTATLSSETPLYLALVLAVIFSYNKGRYGLAGLLAALLVLTRPDGVLLPLVLGVHFLLWVRKPIPWKGLALFVAVSLLGWGSIWAYFGSPIPVTLAAKQHQGLMSISQGFAEGLWTTLSWYRGQLFFQAACGLAMLGLVALAVRKSPAWILIVWTLVYFASYSLLGVTRYFWYYVPLLPGFILLVGAGLDTLKVLAARLTRAALPAVALPLLILAGLFFFQARQVYRQSFTQDRRPQIYKVAGDWLKEHTPAGSKVAALEVGAIGYFSQRYMVDFAGLIQPDVARQMTPSSTYDDTARYAIEHYQPEYVVIYANYTKILEFLTARGCATAVTIPGSDFGFSQDLLIVHCGR